MSIDRAVYQTCTLGQRLCLASAHEVVDVEQRRQCAVPPGSYQASVTPVPAELSSSLQSFIGVCLSHRQNPKRRVSQIQRSRKDSLRTSRRKRCSVRKSAPALVARG